MHPTTNRINTANYSILTSPQKAPKQTATNPKAPQKPPPPGKITTIKARPYHNVSTLHHTTQTKGLQPHPNTTAPHQSYPMQPYDQSLSPAPPIESSTNPAQVHKRDHTQTSHPTHHITKHHQNLSHASTRMLLVLKRSQAKTHKQKPGKLQLHIPAWQAQTQAPQARTRKHPRTHNTQGSIEDTTARLSPRTSIPLPYPSKCTQRAS
jgi:hypothetical protein